MRHQYKYHIASPSKQTLSLSPHYEPFRKNLQSYLDKKVIKNERDYNTALKHIHSLASSLALRTSISPFFKQELTTIAKKKPLTEPTVWGGVTLKKVDVAKDLIQKLLIVKKDGVLGFEIHKKKKEHLKILEGFCIVFFIRHARKSSDTIALQLAGPADEFTFAPNDEHGILTLTHCIIEETSTNHLDDLVYIFNARL